jgi:NACalpha-BTF3-like transcription factor
MEQTYIIDDIDIELVMSQANVSHDIALDALKKNNGDIINAIMMLTSNDDWLKPGETQNGIKIQLSDTTENQKDINIQLLPDTTEDRDIEFVMSKAKVSRDVALDALQKCNGDVIYTITMLFIQYLENSTW